MLRHGKRGELPGRLTGVGARAATWDLVGCLVIPMAGGCDAAAAVEANAVHRELSNDALKQVEIARAATSCVPPLRGMTLTSSYMHNGPTPTPSFTTRTRKYDTAYDRSQLSSEVAELYGNQQVLLIAGIAEGLL